MSLTHGEAFENPVNVPTLIWIFANGWSHFPCDQGTNLLHESLAIICGYKLLIKDL